MTKATLVLWLDDGMAETVRTWTIHRSKFGAEKRFDGVTIKLQFFVLELFPNVANWQNAEFFVLIFCLLLA
jgi:hypothetical protein